MTELEKRELLLEQLERLSEAELDSKLTKLDDETFAELSHLVNRVLEKERKGFDRFFESISQTLKYLPNFLVLAITNKYIEPPIAARITSKLPIKSAVQIAKGLSIDYICNTAIYMDESYAAELLSKLPNKTSKAIILALCESHPLRLLDILAFAEPDSLTRGAVQIESFDSLKPGLNAERKETLRKISQL